MHSIPSNFWMWLASLDPDEREGIIAGIFIGGILVIGMISGLIYSIHKNKTENALKRELLDRGMSADEIATVISAKPGSGRTQRLTRH